MKERYNYSESVMKSIKNYLKNNSNFFSYKNLIIFFILLFIGILSNIFVPFKLFYLFQALLLLMLLLEVKIISKMITFFDELKDKGPDGEVKRLTNLLTSKYILIIAIFFICTFFGTIIFERLVKLNITGVYGILLGIIVFFFGIVAYFYYLILIRFIDRLRVSDFVVDELFPAYNPLIISISKELLIIEKYFFILGSLYTSIYLILSYTHLYHLFQNLGKYSIGDVLIAITWLIIIIFFAFAYPFLVLISRQYLKNLVLSIKQKNINKYLDRIYILQKDKSSEKEAVNNINEISLIIEKIEKSKSSPLEKYHPIGNIFLGITTSLYTIFSPLMIIYLKYWLENNN